jgi:hypothetical protein
MLNPFDIPVPGFRQTDLIFEIQLPTNKGRPRLFSIPAIDLTQNIGSSRSAAGQPFGEDVLVSRNGQ